uniref:Uncharacterized protein n=1 Tax=Anguilla anguilla TaxID=7936 RepID=A0A0E9VJX9_ANGAN
MNELLARMGAESIHRTVLMSVLKGRWHHNFREPLCGMYAKSSADSQPLGNGFP